MHTQEPTEEAGPLALGATLQRMPKPATEYPAGQDASSFCLVHYRLLAYKEQVAGACFWCHPAKAPEGHAVHKLTPSQIAALIPGARQDHKNRKPADEIA